MKKEIPTSAAVVLIVLTLVGMVGLGWYLSGKYSAPERDVRPVIREMNVNKPKTEPLPPDTDVVFMGGAAPSAPGGGGLLGANKGKDKK